MAGGSQAAAATSRYGPRAKRAANTNRIPDGSTASNGDRSRNAAQSARNATTQQVAAIDRT